MGPASSDEGHPVNAASFFFLIAAGVFVLSRRKINWLALFRRNIWVVLYLLYCGLSIAWSDYSFIAFKRWLKDLGNPIMVLIILTEARPYEAFSFIIKRLAFLWLPISVLFIKYFPVLGRAYTAGGMNFGGIGAEKNALGMICLICGILFAWQFLLNGKRDARLGERVDFNVLILVGMGAWLLYMSNSATSISCLAVAVGVFLLGRTKFMIRNPVRNINLVMAVALLYIVLNTTLGISDWIIEMMGRDSTLTTRTTIWSVLEEFKTNPIVGTGYQSFWAGERLIILHNEYSDIIGGINQAHNGYLEQYLNLGYIGLAFIGFILLSGLINIRRYLAVDYPAAILRLCFIVIAVLYNYTEASFYGLNNIWLLTLFAIIEVPTRKTHDETNARQYSIQ
jgi:O-antigen ligase